MKLEYVAVVGFTFLHVFPITLEWKCVKFSLLADN